MKQNIGAKNGKKDKKIQKQNQQRKKKKIILIEQENKKQDLETEKKKEQERKIAIEMEKQSKNRQKRIAKTNSKPTQKIEEKNSSKIKKSLAVETKQENKEPQIKPVITTPTPIQEKERKEDKKKQKISINSIEVPKKEKTTSPTFEDYLEQEVTHILDDIIQDNLYQLKKLDSDIDAIEKNIENTIDDDDLKQIEKEIYLLIEQLNQIKRQILSLETTFDFKFPIEEPDHYLIYLVEELKNKIKNEKELSKNLTDNQLYQSIMDRIIEIENKKEELIEKKKEKEKELALEEEQIQKMNEEVISIDESVERITDFVKKQQEILKEIEKKVNETVQITERTEYITKSVSHSLLELFLLMNIFKRNISMKNNAIAAVEAMVAFELIQKMCTPIKEKVKIQESNLKDYKQIITTYIEDTSKLSNVLNQNLNSISSIRYTFLKDYQNCSHLPEYQHVMNRLDSLEEEMKIRQDEVNRMQKEIEYQLEKNNSKVKKYGIVKAS